MNWNSRIFIVLLFLMDLLQSLMLFTVHLRVSNESRGTFHFLLFFDRCSSKMHEKLNSSQYGNHFVWDSFCISINEFRDKNFKNAKNWISFGSRSKITHPKSAWKSFMKISGSLEIYFLWHSAVWWDLMLESYTSNTILRLLSLEFAEIQIWEKYFS